MPRHVLDLATHLDRDRFEVEVLAGRGEPDEGSLWAEAAERGVVTHRVEALQREVNPRRDLQAYRAIARQIRAGRYDIVHTHISKAGVLGRRAAHRAKTPSVVHTYHGSVAEIGGRSLAGSLFLSIERRAAAVSDRLLAISADVQKHLLSLGVGTGPQFRVIPNGIDLAYFDPAGSYPRPAGVTGSPVIGCIASLTPEKGLATLVEAVPRLAAQYPSLQVCIVGDGPLRADLEREAQAGGLESRVQFCGATADVRPYLSSFDVLALPSLSEGMGRVLMEAMAMNVPVVASRTGGVPEVVTDGETGLLVSPGDPAALAEGLAALLGDEAGRRAMAERARRRVAEEFSLDRMIRSVEQIYMDLVAGSESGRPGQIDVRSYPSDPR